MFLIPAVSLLWSDETASVILQDAGKQAIDIVTSLPVELRDELVLIPKITGLEDSSRYWSAAMTLQHLLIVGKGIQSMVTMLAKGVPVNHIVKIEDVKPDPNVTFDEMLQQYQQFLASYPEAIVAIQDHFAQAEKHHHPWFGAMSAHRWHCLNAVHHQVHLKQIQLIKASFN